MNPDPFKNHLQELCRYNVWANQKISGFIEGAGEERCLKKQDSSFGTIRETLIHILDAQHIWLERLQGRSPQVWHGATFSGSSLQAAAELVESSVNWEKFVDGIHDGGITEMVSYQNIRGQEFHNTVGQIIAHVMNHGTFHRGQIITMLRGSGYKDLKQTDLIAFFRVSGTYS